jgi:hypothetical protein
MDPVTLAAGAIALLGPYLAKAGAEFAGEAGKAAWGLAGRLLGRLRSAVRDKPPDRQALEEFAEGNDGSAAPAQAMLQRVLQSDPELAAEIGQLLAQVKQLGPSVVVVQRVEEAEDAVGVEARRFIKGSVEVTQEMKKAKNITGVRLTDDIG